MPDTTPSQSYENHFNRPDLWLLTGALLIVNFVFYAWAAVKNQGLNDIVNTLAAVALVLLWFQARSYALKNQDRIIRLEMKYRLEKILPAERHADVARLSTGQLIALRFASDAELPQLFDQVSSGKIVKRDEIKRAVKEWQPDWMRV